MDGILRKVPELAFFPELGGCVPRLDAPAPLAGRAAAARVAALAGPDLVAGVRGALDRLRARAEAESNGGLRFLVASLAHFLGSLAAERHPLLVALYLRGADPRIQAPGELALAMDAFDQSLAAGSSAGSRGAR
jgi:hypothetical protein